VFSVSDINTAIIPSLEIFVSLLSILSSSWNLRFFLSYNVRYATKKQCSVFHPLLNNLHYHLCFILNVVINVRFCIITSFTSTSLRPSSNESNPWIFFFVRSASPAAYFDMFEFSGLMRGLFHHSHFLRGLRKLQILHYKDGSLDKCPKFRKSKMSKNF